MENMSNTISNIKIPENYIIASPVDRFIAALLDGLIFAFTYLPFIGLLFWLLGFAYNLVKDALPFLDGQSLGKKVMKLRVLDIDTMKPITNLYDKSAVRYLALFLLIDFVLIFTSPNYRRLGDQWARTIVVKEK